MGVGFDGGLVGEGGGFRRFGGLRQEVGRGYVGLGGGRRGDWPV